MSIDEIGNVLVSYQRHLLQSRKSFKLYQQQCRRANHSIPCSRLLGIRIWSRAIQNGSTMWKGLNLKLNF